MILLNAYVHICIYPLDIYILLKFSDVIELPVPPQPTGRCQCFCVFPFCLLYIWVS